MKKLLASVVLAILVFVSVACGNKYTITYYVNDEVYSVVEHRANSKITLIEGVQQEKCDFLGWTLKDGTLFQQEKMPKENIELYAKYSNLKWNLKFNDGSTVLHSEIVMAGSEINLINDPVRDHHNFIGWRYEDGTMYNGQKMPNKDLNLYAVFEEVDECVRVVINLKDGRKIYVDLYPEIAPITVENFLNLVDIGYYDNVCFHRIIKDFMIQTGGYGFIDNKIVGKPMLTPIVGEFSSNGITNNLKHETGVISMARTNDPNSATSQFFICSATSPHLDGQYAAFGRVCDKDSLQVVLDISYTQTFYVNQMFANFPIYAIIIESIERA